MTNHLSKSRYKRGLHCSKRLWLSTHKHDLGIYKKSFAAYIGDAVGIGATKNYPEGKLVTALFNKHEDAINETLELINNQKVQAIFEAAFEFDDIRIRVDIFERIHDNSWGIREVKSSKSTKDDFYDDIAVQYYVLNNLGYNISSVELIHTDANYTLKTQEVDWQNFFIKKECIDEIKDSLNQVKENIIFLKNIQKNKDEPKIHPSKSFCKECEFWDYCTQNKPIDWIDNLPRLHIKKKKLLNDQCIESISKIPEDFPLTEKQAIVFESTKTKKIYKNRNFYREIKNYKPPVYYFDFETLSCAIPSIQGTKPFEKLPFQWSLHQLDIDEKVQHWEFLATERKDYRREMIESFVNIVESNDNKIIVYHESFEKGILKEMKILYPDIADTIDKIISRIIDLEVFIKNNFYHPEFNGSYSLKKVLPALLPNEIKYNEGAVSDGEQAQETFYNLIFGENNINQKKEIASDLLEYCKKDTESLMLIYKHFLKL